MATNDPRTTRETHAPTQHRLPEFRTIQEAAEFWDTHDSTEFEDEFEDVSEEMRFVLTRPNERWIPLVLDSEAMKALEERAQQEQSAPMALIRDWVLERLRGS